MKITNIRVERLRWNLDLPFSAAWNQTFRTTLGPEVMSFSLHNSFDEHALAANPFDVAEPSAAEEDMEDLVPVLVEDTLSALVIGSTPRMPSAGEAGRS